MRKDTMDISDFETLAVETLENMSERLEQLDEEGTLDIDFLDGVLHLTLESGEEYVINKHLASEQIWLSSPISGASHFSYIEEDEAWIDSDNNDLLDLVAEELTEATSLNVTF